MNFSLTPKRQIILDTLKKSGLISARDLAARCKDIDQATVYRNLDLFVQEGLAKRYHLDSPEAVYEYQEHAHHHAVCSNCGKIAHLDLPEEKILSLFPAESTFRPNGMDITIYGECSACR
jgi:Fe2+ or Zn2+ uptake regulation protein